MQASHQRTESGDAKALVEAANSKLCRGPSEYINSSDEAICRNRKRYVLIESLSTFEYLGVVRKLVKFAIFPEKLVPNIAITGLDSSRNHRRARDSRRHVRGAGGATVERHF